MGETPNQLVQLPTPEQTALVAQVKRKWGIRSYEELRQRRRDLGTSTYLVDSLIPAKTVGILVGDSGLGKSPLLYQLGICVAAGAPFLGHAVQQGRVLYLDFENGLGDSEGLATTLTSFLGLDSVPDDFHVWNLNDCPSKFGQESYTAVEMIREWASLPGPEHKLVFLDSLGAFSPNAEEKNSVANRTVQELRGLNRECGTTIFVVHHIKKPSSRLEDAPPPLNEANLRAWFHQARGASALINASDVRLGVDTLGIGTQLPARNGESSEEIALVLRGFGRIRGEIGPIYLARALDEEGLPMGYRRLASVELLFNSDQKSAYGRLPQNFSFAEAKSVYERRDQATADFLNKCLGLGLLRKPGRGRYEKSEGGGASGVHS